MTATPRLGWWRLGAMVGLQLILLALIAFPRVEAIRSGATVWLRTTPVDPYDPLAGYYVTLRYEVEREALEARPDLAQGTRLWLTLVPGQPATEARDAPPVWRLQAVHTERPLGPEAAVRATLKNGRVRIDGAGRFFVPEDARARVEEALREAPEPALVELRVGADGVAVVRSLWVGSRGFEAR